MPKPNDSRVLAVPAAAPADAAAHFRRILARATDPSDVADDMERGAADYVVLDGRSPDAFARGHVPGAINLPHREISGETTSFFRKDRLIVTYCDGIHCNASTKAALKLAELGFSVKEMIGGLDGWVRDGYAVARGGATAEIPAAGKAAGDAGKAAGDAPKSAGEMAENASAVRCGC